MPFLTVCYILNDYKVSKAAVINSNLLPIKSTFLSSFLPSHFTKDLISHFTLRGKEKDAIILSRIGA